QEARSRFGFFLEALEYGTPPHGGIALGLDRIVMILAGADSLREVIPFPKTARALDLMVDAPTPVNEAQLRELGRQRRKREVQSKLSRYCFGVEQRFSAASKPPDPRSALAAEENTPSAAACSRHRSVAWALNPPGVIATDELFPPSKNLLTQNENSVLTRLNEF